MRSEADLLTIHKSFLITCQSHQNLISLIKTHTLLTAANVRHSMSGIAAQIDRICGTFHCFSASEKLHAGCLQLLCAVTLVNAYLPIFPRIMLRSGSSGLRGQSRSWPRA